MSTPTKRHKPVATVRKPEVAKAVEPEKITNTLFGPDGERVHIYDSDFKLLQCVHGLMHEYPVSFGWKLADCWPNDRPKKAPTPSIEALLYRWIKSYCDEGLHSKDLQPDKLLKDVQRYKAEFESSMEHAREWFRRYPTQVIGNLDPRATEPENDEEDAA